MYNRTSAELPLRYDNAYNKLGMNIKDIPAGRIKWTYNDQLISIFQLCPSVTIDIWDVASLHESGPYELWFKSVEDIESIINFFDLNYWIASADDDGRDNLEYKVSKYSPNDGNDWDFVFIYNKLLNSTFNDTNIHPLKYEYKRKIYNINVYCPILFEDCEKFKDKWFKQLDESREKR